MLTANELRSRLSYDPNTGEFVWREASGRWGRIPAGTIAGVLNDRGYRMIRIDGIAYKASRLAWLYMTGEWPAEYIDHINRNPSDDRFSNLRLATPSQNSANRLRKTDRAIKGAYKVGSTWQAVLCVRGERRYLGRFGTQEEAHAAYATAATAEFGEFARVH